MPKKLKGWLVTAYGIDSYYAAPTSGRAKTLLAYTLEECCYEKSVGDAYKRIRCRRAPWLDAEAQQQKCAAVLVALRRYDKESSMPIPFKVRCKHRSFWTDQDIQQWCKVSDYYRGCMERNCGIPEYNNKDISELLRLNLEILSRHYEDLQAGI